MKKNNTLLSLLCLLFAFTIKLKFVIAKGVHDINNNLLQDGGVHYILPYGVSVASINATQPRAVVLAPAEDSVGIPVEISTLNSASIISIGDLVKFKFHNTILGCKDQSNWILVNDQSAKVQYVGITCAEDKLNNQIKKGNFQIQEYDSDYYLVFCGEIKPTSCDKVGIYIDGAKNKRLVIGSAVSTIFLFPVKFSPPKE